MLCWHQKITNATLEGEGSNKDVDCRVWAVVVCLLPDPRLAVYMEK